ncbi:S41 family peptidase [Sporosarcina sp. JAI121]|uniref:S41 family peptidase n=1 Tax=Sporosarcina sp. JAI121 TaxID=2723064 RepID=UPI00179CCD21|nr:S41 family peptidase [Sporosarcina sp. JAI121]NYF23763.1 carboxyl-terminal processing protease [Sporosarcina sp. JAI121]
MKRNVKSLLLLFSMLVVLLPFATSASAEPLDEIRQLVHEYYVDDVPESVLSKGSIKEITKHLDPHSVYMSAKEYEGFINGIEQRIVGIGVVLEEDLKGIKIISVIPGGPAARAGMEAGDVITHVNGSSLVGKSIQVAISLISGKEKTAVTLTIERIGQKDSLTKKLIREEITLPNVESEMLGGNIAYIRLNSFATESSKEMNKAIQSLTEADGWIVDLRNNGGGYITAAQDIAGFFPTTVNAFQLREKNTKPMIYPSTVQPRKFTGTTHVLINEYSASASEMVSAAVKEQKAATLYGQTSYGKGTMQSMYGFDDGSVLKMTTARFYSPKGQAVDKVGVKPDIVTKIGTELEISHRDQLIAKVPGYKQLPGLVNVPVTKKFTVEMNTKMNWKHTDKKAIQLIQLGGKEIEAAVEVVNDNTISVVPKKQLSAGANYILVIHPLYKDAQNKLMKQGVYLEIAVN